MLTKIQKSICLALKANRNAGSLLAGGSMLNLETPKLSMDLDIFHARREICERHFHADIEMLEKAGFDVVVETTPECRGIGNALVSLDDESTKVQWAVDSAWRFFPAEYDDIAGYRLSFHDLIVNKLICLVDRHYVRDFADVALILEGGTDIAGYLLGVPGKDPGYSLDLYFDIAWRNVTYREGDFSLVPANEIPVNYLANLRRFREAVARVREVMEYVPKVFVGSLFLDDDGNVVLPSKDDFLSGNCRAHSGRPFGSIPEFPGPSPEP